MIEMKEKLNFDNCEWNLTRYLGWIEGICVANSTVEYPVDSYEGENLINHLLYIRELKLKYYDV